MVDTRDTVYGVALFLTEQLLSLHRRGARWSGEQVQEIVTRSQSQVLGSAAAGMLAFNALFEAWLVIQPAGHGAITAVDDLANCVGPLLAFVLFVAVVKPWRHGGRLFSPARQAGPILLALSALAFAGGQAIWTYYELVGHRSTPFPSVADAGYVAAHLLLLAGLLLLPSRPLSLISRSRVLLDSSLLVTAVATFSWYFILGPTALQTGEPLLSKAVSMSYPLLDLVLVLCLILSVRSRDAIMRRAIPPLALGLGVIVFIETIYSYQVFHGAYVTGEVIDPGWSLAYMLVVLGALAAHPRLAGRHEPAALRGENLEPSRSLQLWRALVPYAVLPAVGALMVYATHAERDRSLALGVYVGGALVVTLMVMHQIAVIMENVEVNFRLRGMWKMAAEEAALRSSEARFRTLIQSMDVGVVLLGPEREFLMCNEAARAMLAADTDACRHSIELGSLSCEGDGGERTTGAGVLDRAVATRQPVRNVVVEGRLDDDGRRRWYLMNVVPQHAGTGGVEQIICTLTEITERKQAEEALRESETRFRAIFDGTPVGIEIADTEGRLIATNSALREMLGYSEEDLKGRPFTEITHPEDIAAEEALDEELMAGRLDRYQLEKRHIRKDGQPVWTRLTASEVRDARGEPQFAIAIVEDIRERKEAEQALAYQAMHDALTDLPNRTLFHDRLEQAISAARRNGGSMAILLMDLDRFKDVNDTFGHHYGDLLLQEVSQRLRRTLRESDTVSRLGGDEFGVVLPVADEARAMTVTNKLLLALADPYGLDGHSFDIGASVGIALYPDHGGDANALLRRADVAMYAAKRAAAGFAVYAPEQDQHSPARLALIGDLRRAIEQEEFLLYYQPKMDVGTGAVEQVEALVRWRHPERGLIPPDQFIPLAEQTGLIKPLTLWVVKEALGQVKNWSRDGLELTVAVNLSARSLHDPQLVETVRDLLRTHGVKPSSLGVELTESAVMADPARAMDILTRLRHMGIQIAIDDFGTGYSSLGYLKRLAVDEIKIDKSFVMDMALNNDDAVIVRSVLDLGHNLGLKVVAEGVENERILDVLTSMGCDLAQGYHVCHPLHAEAFMTWLGGSQVRLSQAS